MHTKAIFALSLAYFTTRRKNNQTIILSFIPNPGTNYQGWAS